MKLKKKMENKYINRRGYIIRKASLSVEQIKSIRDDLTVQPFLQLPNQQKSHRFKVYQENENKLYLPIFYATEKFGIPEKNYLHEEIDKTIDHLQFQGSLRDDQLEVVHYFMETCKKGNHGGILQLPCGFGKTICSIFILATLKVKTLIIVHKEFLLNQWVERLNAFLGKDLRIGKIQQSVIDIEDKDVVIAMLQSLALKDYEPTIFSQFQFSIYDECHHLGAEIFSKVLRKVVTKYVLGLSATPNRKDGLRKVFEWFLGPVMIEKKRSPLKSSVHVQIIGFTEKNKFPHIYSPQTRSRLITFICESSLRNKHIMQCLHDIYNEKTRQILILSERRQQLQYFYDELTKLDMSVGYYVGGMKQIDLDKSALQRIVLGTYQMASEGMDIPSLNTIILASPKSDIEQSIGRILRKQHDECIPLVIDILDKDYDNFLRQYFIRVRFYKKMEFEMISNPITFQNPNTLLETNGSCLFTHDKGL